MKHLVSVLGKIHPKGELVNVLGMLIKNIYLQYIDLFQKRFSNHSQRKCFIEVLMLSNLGNLSSFSTQEMEILVSTGSGNCSISQDTTRRQLCPVFQFVLEYSDY